MNSKILGGHVDGTSADTWTGHWHGIDPFTRQAKLRQWFEAWDGLLQGEYLLL